MERLEGSKETTAEDPNNEAFRNLAISWLVRSIVGEKESWDLIREEGAIDKWLVEEGRRIDFSILEEVPSSRIMESILGPDYKQELYCLLDQRVPGE